MTSPIRFGRRTAAPLAAGLLLALTANAQVQWGGSPPSSYLSLSGTVPTITLPAPDVEALRAEDLTRGKNQALRYGALVPISAGLDGAGLWEDLPGGDRVWRLRIDSAGAQSLSLLFALYNLTPGQELYVYDDARTTTLGSFTYMNNKPDGLFSTFPTPGSAINLELFDPAWSTGAPALVLENVVYDYTGVHSLLAGSDARTDCEIDVACPQGAPWTDQINATARILASGALCTGSLVNNTSNDGRQLFFSADHCGTLNNGVFLFNYQTASCGSGFAPQTDTVSGSVRRASSSSLDYQLVELTQTIPSSYNPYLAGWDRSGSFPSNTLTTHHPAGGPKKISFDDDPPQKSGNDWQVLVWDTGVTEPGSSGCPLYDPSGNYIGNLWGGAAACGFPFNDFFTRLDSYWSQVSSHLDPLGTGALSITGCDPYGACGGPPVGLSITSITPGNVPALMPSSSHDVTINGAGFTPTTTVTVDGILLAGFPAPTSYVSSTRIDIDMPQLSKLGSVSVVVANGATTASSTVNVVAPDPPALQIGGGDEPVTLFSFSGADITMSAGPGDLFFLYFSSDPIPSIAPGLVSFTIGNGFSTLWPAGFYVVDPVKAWTQINVPFSGIPPLSTFYFEGFSLPAVPTLPVSVSNRQQVQVVF
jgi:hypothetical protein